MQHKVVIVDDDAGIRRLFENTFSDIGRILSAADGEAGLELIKLEKPELVFLDIDMPGISGLEVLRLIKEAGLASVVWMLTGKEELSVITEAINLGASGYLTKPFEIVKVRGILRSVIMPEAGKNSDRPWRVKRKGGRDPGQQGKGKP